MDKLESHVITITELASSTPGPYLEQAQRSLLLEQMLGVKIPDDEALFVCFVRNSVYGGIRTAAAMPYLPYIDLLAKKITSRIISADR